MKPIETQYKGYRFRSRLEARWAVFLDELGIKWEYEKEGYKFNDGICYLPDFWLPNYEMFIEIKPIFPSTKEFHKAYLLHCSTSYPVMFLWGIEEWSYIGPLICDAVHGDGGGCYEDGLWAGWAWCKKCNVPALQSMFIECTMLHGSNIAPASPCTCNMSLNAWDHYPIEMAIKSARSARFEFGEHGRKP